MDSKEINEVVKRMRDTLMVMKQVKESVHFYGDDLVSMREDVAALCYLADAFDRLLTDLASKLPPECVIRKLSGMSLMEALEGFEIVPKDREAEAADTASGVLLEALTEDEIDGMSYDEARELLEKSGVNLTEYDQRKGLAKKYFSAKYEAMQLRRKLSAMTDAYENMKDYAESQGLDTTAYYSEKG